MSSVAGSKRQDGVPIDPDKLRYFLKVRALSRKRLSARTGIPARVLRYYLAGTRRPREDNFRKLYLALGVGPEDLLNVRVPRRHVIDRSALSNLSAEEALVRLEALLREADWHGATEAAARDCLSVLWDFIRPV
jgi:transcriptional regulator with XRE-family HTH domain